MRAYKRWDASGTRAYATVVGERPQGAQTDLVYHEIPDGTSAILDPVAVLIRYADGREERVAIEDVSRVELSAIGGLVDKSEG